MTIEELKYYANLYSLTPAGEWMNELNWRKASIRIADGPGIGSRWFINLILIDPISTDMTDSMQFGTYIHELRHIWQRKKQGCIKYAIRNLFQRNEPDAEDQDDKAQNWLGDEKCRELRHGGRVHVQSR
jgi:hypothetical protein